VKKQLAVAALAGALLLSACSAPEPAIDKDAIYLKLVHDETSNTASDSTLVDMAKGACKELESGSTMKDIQRAIGQLDVPQSSKVEVARIVGFGIGVYCPEFS
jgi:outer membrane protein assembly factor BamE (lipoprotein component of BamABCDE complex)